MTFHHHPERPAEAGAITYAQAEIAFRKIEKARPVTPMEQIWINEARRGRASYGMLQSLLAAASAIEVATPN